MTVADLQRASGLSLRALYYLRDGRPPNSNTIQKLRLVFPDVAFDELFVPVDSAVVQDLSTEVQQKEAVAA